MPAVFVSAFHTVRRDTVYGESRWKNDCHLTIIRRNFYPLSLDHSACLLASAGPLSHLQESIFARQRSAAPEVVMPKKFYVSWDNLQREARRLARRQLPVSQWKGIIAVSRGGLVPAALMARELGIRNVETLCISSYDHDNQRELVVVKPATTAGDGEGWLVVDDLVDTGGTAKAIRELYPRAKFITIFAKPQGEPLVDDFEVSIPQDTWIEQPWDMALEFMTPICDEE